MRARFSVLVLALAAATAAALPVSTIADTVALDDSADDTAPAHIRTMVVDNTGDGVGVQVRHRGISWTGAVDLRVDVGGGPRAEFFAVIERGTGEATSLRTGSPVSSQGCRSTACRCCRSLAMVTAGGHARCSPRPASVASCATLTRRASR
jgi:hypothetical protein